MHNVLKFAPRFRSGASPTRFFGRCHCLVHLLLQWWRSSTSLRKQTNFFGSKVTATETPSSRFWDYSIQFNNGSKIGCNSQQRGYKLTRNSARSDQPLVTSTELELNWKLQSLGGHTGKSHPTDEDHQLVFLMLYCYYVPRQVLWTQVWLNNAIWGSQKSVWLIKEGAIDGKLRVWQRTSIIRYKRIHYSLVET